jgi:hypothetical protein
MVPGDLRTSIQHTTGAGLITGFGMGITVSRQNRLTGKEV